MKAISLLVNSYLPEDMRTYNETYDVKGMNRLMRAVAERHPDKFADITQKLSNLGRTASYVQGETITLKDLEPVIDRKGILDQMAAEIKALPRDGSFKQRRRELFQKYTDIIEKQTADNALKNRNNIALSVMSGARGKTPQLRAMISPVGTFSDYKGEVIDVYSKESFADGIRPTTFLASTYGARSSVTSTKCLAVNTLVRLSNGQVRPIQEVDPGYEIMGADTEGNIFPVTVLNMFDQGMKDCYKYYIRHADKDIEIICTPDHKMLLPTGEVRPIGEVQDGEDLFGGYTITHRKHEGDWICFDLEVDHPAHLFVLESGIITSNSGTAKGGDLAKQFASSAADMVIRREDCGTSNGIPLEPDDDSLVGRVLARDTDGFKAGTVITRQMAATLQKAGHKYVMARSAMTCSCPDGLCAKCVGKVYKGGKFPHIGDAVGLTASTTAMEPVTQMALCLAGDTPVRMVHGPAKAIADIKVGDKVWGVGTDGTKAESRVLNVFVRKSTFLRIYTLLTESGKRIRVTCSELHKFLSNDEDMVEERYARPITVCYSAGFDIGVLQHDELKWCAVVRVTQPFLADAYDIEIDHTSHLFLLGNGLVTSNSAKHTAGMTKGKKSYSGLAVIQQFTQSPEKFKDIGVVSELDGKVDSIEEAPQGGTYVTISGERHYVPAGHEVQVKEGQTVEAGDQLAEGLVDAEDVVRLKGLGAGRKYYAERLNKILEDSGAKTDKRNTEILARAAIRHVRVANDSGIGNYLPDDVVDYSALQSSYVPREVETKRARDAVGGYLAKQVMYYTVGTRITPSVAKDIEDHEYTDVDVSPYEPEFTPEMQRLRTASHANEDWLASMTTSYLTQQLNESSTRGDDTNIKANKDYRPRIMYGENFGKNVGQTGVF